MPKVPKRRTPKRRVPVRDSLLASAKKLFAEKGFEGASVKDLARDSGHNAALINYYFTSKEGLYRECMAPLTGLGNSQLTRTLRAPTSREDFLTRFQLFVEDFITYHLQQKDLCVILKRDSHTEVVKQLYREHFRSLDTSLKRFLRSARQAGYLRKGFDVALGAHFVLSALFHLIATEQFRVEVGQTAFLNSSRRDATVRAVTGYLLFGIAEAAG